MTESSDDKREFASMTWVKGLPCGLCLPGKDDSIEVIILAGTTDFIEAAPIADKINAAHRAVVERAVADERESNRRRHLERMAKSEPPL